ncbi:sulfhydryl oxidase 1-like isoform X2 [Argiope bruennichi]|uniref:sulfhydryl oxidase 1-like isoform X2 n=1 Tax=Argiope bruennichi TaxID=94029 RepID=UPI002494646E|nr:sulfhydryl oxidase 1-like isoform X2 [Argiope bruennichi]
MNFKYLIFNASQFILLFSISLAYKSRQSSLYSDDDPLWELDSSNFNGVIFGKNNAWIVEFYNNWCGHCIRYAPTWKQFAREIRTWKKVIDVAVVNCNDAQNINLCRYYEVDSFPTIKLFWHHTTANDSGEMLEGKRDIISVENRIIDFLETNWNRGVPKEWPNIQPLEKYSHEIFDELNEGKQSIMAFAEYPYNYVGRKVILDLSFQTNLLVRRVLTRDEDIIKNLKIEVSNETLPVLMRLNPDSHHVTIFKFSQDMNDTYIRDQIYHNLVGVERSKTKIEDAHSEGKPKDSGTMAEAVYRIDLENAVYNSLNKEIAVAKMIEGEKLFALKSYLSILKNYFPGTKPIMGYLSNLHDWAANKTAAISGEEFAQALQDIQNDAEYIPPMRDWVGCKGSKPKYRGYPCSLWTLFHTLTVQADKRSDKIQEGPKGKDVLFVIRDYIKYFFTCEECSKNFQKMATNIEDEVKNSQDAVLWLWEAHNKANHRLSGDVTEDPKHPKIQFPSPQICSKCRIRDTLNGEIVWDKAVVLQFLHKFYDEQNILSADHRKASDSLVVDQGEQENNSAMGVKFILSPTSALLLLLLSYFHQSLKIF